MRPTISAWHMSALAGASLLFPPEGLAQQKTAVPGWKVEIFALQEGAVSSSPVVRTTAPIGRNSFGFKMGDKPRYLDGVLHGTAYFNVEQAGDYLFEFEVDTSRSDEVSCTGRFEVEGLDVVPEFSSSNAPVATGQIVLEPGIFEVGFDLSCSITGWVCQTCMISRDNILKQVFYNIRVQGEQDTDVREFRSDELFLVIAKS